MRRRLCTVVVVWMTTSAAVALGVTACGVRATRSVAAAPLPVPSCSVEVDAPHLAGAGAVDCGVAVFIGDEEPSRRGRACILDALAQQKPFFASVVGPSFDSHYVEGFVGHRVGGRYEMLHLQSDQMGGVAEPPTWFAFTCQPLEDLATKCDASRSWEGVERLSPACSAFVDHIGGGPNKRVFERYGLWCNAEAPSEECIRGVRGPASKP